MNRVPTAPAATLLHAGAPPAGPDTSRPADGVGLRLIRVVARVVGALIVGALTVAVSVAWAWAEVSRAVRTSVHRRRDRGAGAAARSQCVWCGYRHTRHPVLVHSDGWARRFSERITA
ncbi:hypothetical protein [Pseudonocardia yuanmonensis]|uniref:hypothetical protein n=1 Tax=Pseudonocardia yuanmonensis TaxID=1095914 RepID=UPI0031EFA9D0